MLGMLIIFGPRVNENHRDTAWVYAPHYACRGGVLAKGFVLSLVDRSVGKIAGADVFGTRTDELVIAVLFEDVAGPA